MAAIERTCICGASFTVEKPSNPKRFCTMGCAVRNTIPTKEQVCALCGISFMFKGRTRCVYCRDCYRTVRINAVVRSKIKTGRVMKVGVGSGGNQFGDDNPSRKAGKVCLTNYRKTCFKYWDKVCAVCRSESYIEVHHINDDPANSQPNNLIPICRACHRSVHKLANRTGQDCETVLFSLWPDGRIKIAEKIGNPEMEIRGEGQEQSPVQPQRLLGEPAQAEYKPARGRDNRKVEKIVWTNANNKALELSDKEPSR